MVIFACFIVSDITYSTNMLLIFISVAMNLSMHTCYLSPDLQFTTLLINKGICMNRLYPYEPG
jgi:hypothetical protein